MKPSLPLAAAAVLLSICGAAHAELQPRGGGMVYDTVLDITWITDMNLARTSGASATGKMRWDDARLWAENLEYAGFSDWRLPTVDPSDTSCSSVTVVPGFPAQRHGWNCTGGELSHLFVVDFGNRGGESVFDATGDTAQQRANLALFTNVPDDLLWAGTTYAPNTDYAWIFVTRTGSQTWFDKDFAAMQAVAVRPGDVAAVPEPQALTLLAAGLAVVSLLKRRRGVA